MSAAALFEAELVGALQLAPLPLPPELAAAEGQWRHAPAKLEARAYESDRVAYARWVTIQGVGLSITNILCIARPGLPVPVLGADLVALGQDCVVVAVDLSPAGMDAASSTPPSPYGALLEALARAPKLSGAAPLPVWAQRIFSPHALFARPPRPEWDRVTDAISPFFQVFSESCSQPSEGAGITAFELRRYLFIHRTEDRALRLLDGIFGSDFTEAFLSQVLFPEVRFS